MALLKLRRHTYFLDCDSIEVKEVSNGRFEVTLEGPDRKFIVIGGTKSGGSAREWFVYCPELLGEKYYPATSMIAAIRAGVYI